MHPVLSLARPLVTACRDRDCSSSGCVCVVCLRDVRVWGVSGVCVCVREVDLGGEKVNLSKLTQKTCSDGACLFTSGCCINDDAAVSMAAVITIWALRVGCIQSNQEVCDRDSFYEAESRPTSPIPTEVQRSTDMST